VGKGHKAKRLDQKGATLAREFLSSRKLEPRASREISPSRLEGRTLKWFPEKVMNSKTKELMQAL
jgi:hypothetical protein